VALDEGSDFGPFADDVTPVREDRPTRARPQRPRTAAKRFRTASAPLDARQLYMNQIQDIPVLDREEVAALSYQIREHQNEFERSLLGIPGAVRLVVEHWESRRQRGLVTAVMCRHARDGSRRDWGKHIDAHLSRAQQHLARTPVPQTRVTETLIRAELAFELLIEIHSEVLRAAAPEADRAERRRLGLEAAAARRKLACAERALAEYHRFVQVFAHHNLRLVAKCAARPRIHGSGAGGKSRLDSRDREVRARARLHVLDLRRVVDSAGDDPRDPESAAHRARALTHL
jgi:hypothetical protein